LAKQNAAAAIKSSAAKKRDNWAGLNLQQLNSIDAAAELQR
jgi:hypothetical protein